MSFLILLPILTLRVTSVISRYIMWSSPGVSMFCIICMSFECKHLPLISPIYPLFAHLPFIRPFTLYSPIYPLFAHLPFIRPFTLYSPIYPLFAHLPFIRPFTLYSIDSHHHGVIIYNIV